MFKTRRFRWLLLLSLMLLALAGLSVGGLTASAAGGGHGGGHPPLEVTAAEGYPPLAAAVAS